MYEVEIKVELTKEEKDSLILEFKARNFEFKGLTPQNDFYIEAEKSIHGGYDLKRYRSEAGKYIFTQKTWETSGDTKARREDEHEVTKEEFDSTILNYPNAIKIIKDREWYKGIFKDKNISLTIDTVKFDHSPNIRYFLEAEIDVPEKAEVAFTKELISDFLKDILHKPEIIEAKGMFTMTFDKK